LASFTLDKSGRYIAHSPFANIDTIENLEASEEIPFPTGIQLEVSDKSSLNYNNVVSIGTIDEHKPFYVVQGREETELRLNLKTPETINIFSKFINYCNRVGYIPTSSDPRLA